jgi:hypothetical protein
MNRGGGSVPLWSISAEEKAAEIFEEELSPST